MKKLKSKQGFTLAELLIVVAIIAILVAIGIPAFSTAMERSRETVDLSNVRGAYAEFMAGTLGNAANIGYYKVDVKQRDIDKWVVDCSGFLTNVDEDDMPKPKQTGTNWVRFMAIGSDEKPKVEFVEDDGTGKKPKDFSMTYDKEYDLSASIPVTKGYVSSGDGWWLCKSGT